jgi:hypothetical protein
VILEGHLYPDLVVRKRGLVQLRKEVGGVVLVDSVQGDGVGENVVHKVVALFREH